MSVMAALRPVVIVNGESEGVVVGWCAAANIETMSSSPRAIANKTPVVVRKSSEADPRVVRTTHALAKALVELMLERDFDSITVRSILERARVGRTAFYAHYRNKTDVLHSGFERVLAVFEPALDRPSPAGRRLFPLAEFVSHIGEVGPVFEALRAAGQLDDIWNLGVAHAARMIENRIEPLPGTTPSMSRSLVARMLAGAAMESVSWWHDNRPASTAEQVDRAFHDIARGALRRASYGIRL
jgi:AcrR family transcriptional regulator